MLNIQLMYVVYQIFMRLKCNIMVWLQFRSEIGEFT